MNRQDIYVGQKLLVEGERYPGVWTVSKLNPTNIKLQQNGRRLNAHPDFLSVYDGEAGDELPVTGRPIVLPIAVGAVVWLRGKDGLFVVIRDNGDTASVAKLGGDSGRYWRVPRSAITEVNPALISLAASPDDADDR